MYVYGTYVTLCQCYVIVTTLLMITKLINEWKCAYLEFSQIIHVYTYNGLMLLIRFIYVSANAMLCMLWNICNIMSIT